MTGTKFTEQERVNLIVALSSLEKLIKNAEGYKEHIPFDEISRMEWRVMECVGTLMDSPETRDMLDKAGEPGENK